MLAFPILGVSLYLLVGLNGSTKKMRARYEEIDKKLLPYLPDNRQILEWMKKENPQAGAIASYLTNYSCYPVYQNTDVTYYDEAIKGWMHSWRIFQRQKSSSLWSIMPLKTKKHGNGSRRYLKIV